MSKLSEMTNTAFFKNEEEIHAKWSKSCSDIFENHLKDKIDDGIDKRIYIDFVMIPSVIVQAMSQKFGIPIEEAEEVYQYERECVLEDDFESHENVKESLNIEDTKTQQSNSDEQDSFIPDLVSED